MSATLGTVRKRLEPTLESGPIDDQPWRRAYAVLKPGAQDSFVAEKG